jgi:hypothetical protein
MSDIVAEMEQIWRGCIEDKSPPEWIIVGDSFMFVYKRLMAVASKWWAKPSGGKMSRRLNRKRIAYGH